jgi:DNA mismatch repair protein MutH
LGVELKVTPFKKNKNGTYSAKELLVLNIIDYMKEFKLTFETSSFMSKAAKMLIRLTGDGSYSTFLVELEPSPLPKKL